MLSDRLLRSWIRCRRKAWLDSFGDRKQRHWKAHHSLQLDHQQKSFAALLEEPPGKGIQSCIAGSSGILGIKLKNRMPTGQLISANPPLLQKVSGESVWGEYAYRPVLARQGKRNTRELKQALALTGLLLEPLQNAFVPNGITVSKTNQGLEIDRISLNEGLKKQLNLSLSKLSEDLNLKNPPPIISDRKKCTICSWQSLCDSEAKAKGFLSEVSGIGHKRKEILEELGINQIKDLALSNPNELSKKLLPISKQNDDLAYLLISQAKVQLNGKPKRINHSKALQELEHANGVLIYDIESDSDSQEDFLHGFVRIDRKKNGDWDLKNAKYHPILILFEDKRSKQWERLRTKLNKYRNWPVLHYGETEIIAIRKLAIQQKIPAKELQLLDQRFIDVHQRIRKHWLLPVNSYGLKVVAEWVGFRWQQINPDGSKALLWWRKWNSKNSNKKRSPNCLKKIFRYNQDDCLATWAAAEWLLNQDNKIFKINKG